MTNLDKLLKMAELQDKVNTMTNPNWREANYNWNRYMVVELAEAHDHLGYKHWKKQEPNIPQFEIEIVDVFHFYLSDLLNLDDEGDIVNESLDILNEELLFLENNTKESPYIQSLEYNKIELQNYIDNLIYSISIGDMEGDLCILLYHGLQHSGNPIDRLYELYIQKNALNIYRLQNGYKEGTYKKVINGQEDNEALEIILTEEHNNDINYILSRLAELHPQE